MKPTIPFSDFSRLDLRVGIVTAAKPIADTDNLLQLTVDLGEVGKRQLVGGLARTHKSSKLVGKQVVVVVNLEVREIRGINSQGMLLAAEVEGAPVLLVPEKDVPSGTKIR